MILNNISNINFFTLIDRVSCLTAFMALIEIKQLCNTYRIYQKSEGVLATISSLIISRWIF